MTEKVALLKNSLRFYERKHNCNCNGGKSWLATFAKKMELFEMFSNSV